VPRVVDRERSEGYLIDMHRDHTYRALLVWEGNHGEGTATYQGYGRRWRAFIDGKPDLVGTADPAFRGEPERHNPEDLLVVSLSSCHMLTYLALCAQNRISVVSYSDEVTGVMATTPEGGGRFKSVTLRPKVEITDAARLETARQLHEKAHALCFIAASVNFPVHHEARVSAAPATGASA
jgi:organic hydroperoxide reductase OsmC/OhrA